MGGIAAAAGGEIRLTPVVATPGRLWAATSLFKHPRKV